MRSEMRMAASTRPPGVSMRKATPLAPSRSARARACSTKTAKAGSISPWMGMRKVFPRARGRRKARVKSLFTALILSVSPGPGYP